MYTLLRRIAVLGLLAPLGCSAPSLLITPVSGNRPLQEFTVETAPKDAKGAGGKVAVIEVEGLLINARVGGILAPQENKVALLVEQLRLAEEDDDVKAVLLRVNSPGGTVSASDTMYREVVSFRKRSGKKVVAAITDVGASGGYYVACGADEIIAQPSSIVGSVGVVMQTFDASGAMAKLGITSDAVVSGPHKDAGSPFRHMRADEREIFQGMIDAYFSRFKEVVQTRQHIADPAKLAIATDGRVFTGTQALDVGLVDRTGSLNDALNRARSLGGAPRAKAVMYRRPYGGDTGSVYASAPPPTPPAFGGSGVMQVVVPGFNDLLPGGGGFYYLWRPATP